MSIGSEKSPLNSSDSSCANAFLAITVPRCGQPDVPQRRFRKGHIPSKACSTFTASLALVSKYGIPPFDWQKVIARFEEIMRLFSSTSILFPSTTLNDISPRLLLRSNSTHKRKVLRVSRASLYQELVSPAIQGIEALRIIDIVHEYAAVGSSIECNT